MFKKMGKNKKAFTIVELLVVIVVIGILAAITIVSYSGVQKKATVASLQTELKSAGRLMSLYRVDHETFPSAISASGCPTAPSEDGAYCIKVSGGVNFSYSSNSGSEFSLTFTKNGTTCRITEDQTPYEVGPAPLTAIADITGNTQVSKILTAGSVAPEGATVSYQWQSSATSGGTYTDISGATSSTYTLTSNEFKKYIKVVVTGIGDFQGKQTSNPTASYITTPLTSVGNITGTLLISQTLTSGSVLPAGATFTYQWQSSATSNGTYADLSGATSSTYIVSPVTMNKYLRVAITGTGDYGGTIYSNPTASVIPNDANWMIIGTQAWAVANSNLGTLVTVKTVQSNNAILEKYCYSDTESNCTTYGALYQWAEVLQYNLSEKAQGICVAGSHIPTDSEWKTIEMYLGMTQGQADTSGGGRGTDQGAQMKVGGSSGLNLQLSGTRDNRNAGGAYWNLNSWGNYWSSTSYNTASAFSRDFSGSNTIERGIMDKTYGNSVCCIGN